MQDIRRIKPYNELVYRDDYMFCAVNTDRQVAQEVAKVTTGRIIKDIEILSSQTEIRSNPEAKAIRTDVFVEGSDVIFDYEMQNRRAKDIYERARSYLSNIDSKQLLKGVKYGDLKQVYIMFFCIKDPFGYGLPIYTFPDECHENGMVVGKSHGVKIIYDCSQWAKVQDPELSAYLRYIVEGVVSSKLTRLIDDLVNKNRRSSRGEIIYMTSEMVLREERDAGREEERLANLKSMAALGLSYEMLSQGFHIPIDDIKTMLGTV